MRLSPAQTDSAASSKGAAVAAIAIVSLGFAFRLWWALEFDTLPNHDMKAYVEFAQSIAKGEGYVAFGQPTAYWPVGYPAVLAVLLWLGGGDLLVARIAQAVFGLVSLACIFRLVRTYSSSAVAAIAATAWAAFDITQIAYSSILVSEPLFNCLMLLGAVFSVGPDRTRRRMLLGGACFGLAAYTRAHGLFLPLLCGLFGVVGGWSDWRTRARRVAWLYLGLCLVMAPWWVRNAMVFKAFVPVSNNGGINLFIGNNPRATGGYKWNKEIKAPLARAHRGRHRGGRGEYERGEAASKLAWEFIRENPTRFAELAYIKLKKLYQPDLLSVRWNKPLASEEKRKKRALKRVWQPRVRTYHASLCLAAALGCLVAWRGRWPVVVLGHTVVSLLAAHFGHWWLGALCVLLLPLRLLRERNREFPVLLPIAVAGTFTAVHMLYFANGRFLHPVRPWMAVAAGILVAWLVEHGRSSRTRDNRDAAT